jgi:ketosteroid isomerase-like protein
MSQENVKRVKASIEAYNGGDYQAALAYFDPSVEWRVPAEMDLDIGVLRGREGVLALWKMVAETFGGFQLVDLEFSEAGQRVVVRTRLVGQGRRSGVPTEMELGQVAELENGLITRIEYFTSHASALEAAGLQE